MAPKTRIFWYAFDRHEIEGGGFSDGCYVVSRVSLMKTVHWLQSHMAKPLKMMPNGRVLFNVELTPSDLDEDTVRKLCQSSDWGIITLEEHPHDPETTVRTRIDNV